MRIAVINLTGGGASGGYLRYLEAMLPRLAASPEVSAVLCAAPPALGFDRLFAGTPKAEFSVCEPFRFMRHSPGPLLKAALDAFAPDAIFVPLERYVRYRDVPVVCVVHNMAPLTGAGTGGGLFIRLKSYAQSLETKLAVRRSAAVLTPTFFVRDFLISRLGADEDRVKAAHFGPSPVPASPARPAGTLSDLKGRFIFSAGSMEHYRGLEDLIEAMPDILRSAPGVKLLAAGWARPATQPYLARLKELAGKLGVSGDIIWLGGISREELAWCYANCSAFVMTSRLESFGFPALEAMQQGCQCVSSSSPCLPEIFGNAAVYYPPGDHVALAARLKAALSRGFAEREKYSTLALARAGEFSWDKAADATMEVMIQSLSRR